MSDRGQGKRTDAGDGAAGDDLAALEDRYRGLRAGSAELTDRVATARQAMVGNLRAHQRAKSEYRETIRRQRAEAGRREVERLLAAALRRDAEAERRDREAEARDAAATLRDQTWDGDPAHPMVAGARRDRDLAAVDRRMSGRDRDAGASDRHTLVRHAERVARASLQDAEESEGEISNLTTALETRSEIGIAVGLLMRSSGCGADEAYQLLVRSSQHAGRKLRLVAAEIVARAHDAGGTGEHERADGSG